MSCCRDVERWLRMEMSVLVHVSRVQGCVSGAECRGPPYRAWMNT